VNDQSEIKAKIIEIVKSALDWFDDKDYERAYGYALADYLFYKYPSANDRPSADALVIDFMIKNWLAQRMEDILSRGAGNAEAYSENGISWEYASSHIDPSLVAKIVPNAAVPR